MKKVQGIKILEEIEGVGVKIKNGDTIRIKLNGWLNKGNQFQKDYFDEVILGSRNLIPGIEYAIEGMRKNGMRIVRISPHLGYRDKGVEGIIPPNAVLIYQIELIDVIVGDE